MAKFLLAAMLLASVVLVSGCTTLDPTALAKSSPAVSNFLKDYPNAEVKATFYSAEESAAILDQIKADCEKESVTAKDYYKVMVNDSGSGLSVVAWVDVSRQIVECVVKKGVAVKDISENESTSVCTPNDDAKCSNGHLYWYNSCGEKGEKKEYCDYGCEDSKCKDKPECELEEEAKCYGGHLYWYDSCGKKGEKKEVCENGCEDGACVVLCEGHETYACKDGHIYWYDSCGGVQERKRECKDGCEYGRCLEDSYCIGTVTAGSSMTVTIGGDEHTITVVGVGENNDAVIDIDGDQFNVDTDTGGVVDITKDDLKVHIQAIRAVKFPVESGSVQLWYNCDTENEDVEKCENANLAIKKVTYDNEGKITLMLFNSGTVPLSGFEFQVTYDDSGPSTPSEWNIDYTLNANSYETFSHALDDTNVDFIEVRSTECPVAYDLIRGYDITSG